MSARGLSGETKTMGMYGGTFGGSADLKASGLVEFTAGSIGGGGGQVIANGGLSISGNANKTLGAYGSILSSGLVNASSGTWSGTGNLDNWSSGRFTNAAGASFDIQTDADFVRGTFINAGTLIKSIGAGGAAKTLVSGTFNNSGLVDIRQGRLALSQPFTNEGTVTVQAGAELQAESAGLVNNGLMHGNGTIRTYAMGALLNRGIVGPGTSTGRLTIDGDLQMDPAGTLQFELTDVADFDLLVVTDDVTFAGTLEVINLNYRPAIGETFKIITFDDRLGNSVFDSVKVTGFSQAVHFSVTYNPHDVTLNVTAVPEPASWAMGLVGLGALALWRARRRMPGVDAACGVW